MLSCQQSRQRSVERETARCLEKNKHTSPLLQSIEKAVLAFPVSLTNLLIGRPRFNSTLGKYRNFNPLKHILVYHLNSILKKFPEDVILIFLRNIGTIKQPSRSVSYWSRQQWGGIFFGVRSEESMAGENSQQRN
jgi:hypothetical protein